MKRLLLMFAAAFAVVFAQAAFAQHNEAQKPQSGGKRTVTSSPTTGTQALAYPRGPGQNPKEYSASVTAFLQPFLPKDTKVGVGWMVGKRCDQNGSFTEQGSAMCMIWVSHSVGKTYIFRPSEQEGDRVFERSGGTAVPYVHFNGGRYTSTVASMSPAAEQFAAANGYQLNQKDKTMVASNGAAPSAVPAVVAAVPSPQGTATTPDCSKGTFVERKLCKQLGGAGAAAVGAIK